ncbi:carboxymuconolactone decarboxylase family protein [Methylotenera sp.]|uniref:carboxymuconolactone decarboxylase family protein n=1 Tax=Methylotenera sp. TaxID=2051956 RepID=UPI002489B35D|nr:carboxymuconolactone decarboxylase family protein [Methylotenera sp.]MDI1360519.1 carboxymuconolactone decarboxylase family protein [Methylotenera sp.]
MSRIDYFLHSPELITKMRNITQGLEQFTIDGKLRALVETRVSQVNGCVYCVDLHLRESRKLGELQQRLDSLPVWKESPFFDEREKAALAWAESLTNIAQTHAGETEYSTMKQFFSDLEIVELSISISLANFWNRMAGGFRRMPKQANVE